MARKKRGPGRPPKPLGTAVGNVLSERGHIIDADGRMIGFMWPEDFEAHNFVTFGKEWIGEFARYAGVGRSIVSKYKNGKNPIPKTIALITIQARWIHQHRKGKVLPKLEYPWLEDR